MNYIIVKEYLNPHNIVKSYNYFIESVNKKISQGYEPVGGICYVDGNIIQAMIKKGVLK